MGGEWILYLAALAPFVLIGFIVARNYNYKEAKLMAERLSLEQLGEWYKAKAEAKALANRWRGSSAWLWGGLLAGVGLGLAIATVIAMYAPNAMQTTYEMARQISGDRYINTINYIPAIFASLALLCGGAGLIGGYFLERKFNKKSE
jgi:uncharacterized protein YneF (UPF0154 family)